MSVNYAIFVFPLTTMIVLLLSVVVPPEAVSSLLLARLYDTILGVVLAFLGTIILFPSHLKIKK